MPSLTNFLTDETSIFKYKCNKIVKQHYLELWTKQAHSIKEGKLRNYLKIKTNFGYENYFLYGLHGKYNEVNNGSHLLPDPKCTCSRIGDLQTG
jgi:hypothetical protein